MSAEIIWLLLGLGAGGVFAWFFIARQLSDNFKYLNEQLNQRLRENVAAMNESKSFLADRVSSAERSVREVSSGLGKLEHATATLQKTSNEITSFQTMLKNPKIRGSFGEVLLTNLLAEVLPHDRYHTQYTFPHGEIADAVVLLQDGHLVAIDAKFPLANYEAYAAEEDENVRHQLRQQFLRDVKKHITDISKKYISPEHKTLDFAFMYIPIEGIYYETMIHDKSGVNLWEICQHNKVIPTSPNSFLAYLQTVLMGLRGLKIEQQAKEILQHLGQLRGDFGKFAEDFSTVGTHLTNAKNRFDDSARRLDKFGNRLEQIELGDAPPKLDQ
ncbi:MAG: DNA recombination protein RmuC [bacterium]